MVRSKPCDEIAIVGAGLGGLTCALALMQMGRRVRVYEQSPVLAEIGAGITLSPNASRVFQYLGLGEGLDQMGYVPPKQWTQAMHSGALLVERERGAMMQSTYGAPYTHLHRADLHRLLTEALLHLDAGAIVLDHKAAQVTAMGEVHFANGVTVRAGAVIGADGVKSVVRDQLFEVSPPQFTGQVAWRGVVPLDALSADVQALPPGIWIGEDRLFMRYPMRGGSLINYAAFVNCDGWDQEGWMIASTREELLSEFVGAEANLQDMIRATPDDQLFKWAIHARDPLNSWIAGRVTLLGDAAHAMLPFMGQGAATSIEDGMVLARCLDAFPRDEAFVRYQAARLERTTMIQTQSRLLGLQFQGKDPESFGKGPIQNEETLGLFAYDAVTVSI